MDNLRRVVILFRGRWNRSRSPIRLGHVRGTVPRYKLNARAGQGSSDTTDYIDRGRGRIEIERARASLAGH